MRMVRLLCLVLAAAPAWMARAQPRPPPMTISPWVSLAPAPGAVEARLGMRAQASRTDEADGSETITVIGHKRAPVEAEELRREAPGAEAWQSDAAQPVVPGLGDSCSYKSGCFDKQQKGLFDTIPALLGDN